MIKRCLFFVSFILFFSSCIDEGPSDYTQTMGCDLNQKQFDKAEVFEPLSSAAPSYSSPGKVSLLQFAPKRLSQGNKGSCTSWAACYAAGSILWTQATGKNPNDLAFSPDFIYNQMTHGNCTGTNIAEALKLILKKGLIP